MPALWMLSGVREGSVEVVICEHAHLQGHLDAVRGIVKSSAVWRLAAASMAPSSMDNFELWLEDLHILADRARDTPQGVSKQFRVLANGTTLILTRGLRSSHLLFVSCLDQKISVRSSSVTMTVNTIQKGRRLCV